MLTAHQRGSLVSYAMKRKKTYRDSLPAVNEWITRLKKDDVSRFIGEVIQNMIQEDPNLRRKAAEIKEAFDARDFLACPLCSFT